MKEKKRKNETEMKEMKGEVDAHLAQKSGKSVSAELGGTQGGVYSIDD
jgi:hypothetical protein